ncbi:hypothetical protein D6855_04105 [Butyrivibrio sp. CB08]|uniref:hypothetical protein n=1 Tax=Butyrivibrio sp. CB08 TaxID=2364879 RepID=UPI000EA8CE2A|nr:hypothetical protein [Butyrivibrio sp. CB08]RKM61090.1 hypothetical protein D6855_04105 [Butyrivibrio sp. CB08]
MAISSIGVKNLYAKSYNGTSNKTGTVNKFTSNQTSNTGKSSGTSITRLEYNNRLEQKQKQSVIEQSMSYAKQLSASRTKTEKSSLEKKKLQYSFKKISSQIIRSKTSVTARKAVQAAKREIMRLKRLRANGEYDEEELQLAIDHAKSMEKVAKKKVNHLEQEEMIERNGKGLSGAIKEFEEEREEVAEEENDELSKELEEGLNPDEMDYELEEGLEDYDYEMALQMQDFATEFQIPVEELSGSMDDMMDQLMEAMGDMLEELDLSELSESMVAPDPNMSEEDLKMLKIKHRFKELKEIAEADKQYLKGIMEHEKSKQANGMAGAMGSGHSGSPSAVFKSDMPGITPVISMPGAAAGGAMMAPATSGGFDVSV